MKDKKQQLAFETLCRFIAHLENLRSFCKLMIKVTTCMWFFLSEGFVNRNIFISPVTLTAELHVVLFAFLHGY